MQVDCEQFEGRKRQICEGTSGLPEETRQAYLALWAEELKPDSNRIQTGFKPDIRLCSHRGPLLETRLCDLCGIKGQPFEVYACQLHGECSEQRKHSKVRSCIGCPDHLAVATQDDVK